jgi:hypothetical protein
MYLTTVPPDADVHELICVVWHHVHIDVYAQGHVGHLYGMVELRVAPEAWVARSPSSSGWTAVA